VAKKCHTTRTSNETGNNICCPPPIPGTLFLCGESVYPYLFQAWKGISGS
jgi:hypothetical protein